MKMPNLSSLLNTFILLISSGLAVILSKKVISISLLIKETMNYLSDMKIKQFVKNSFSYTFLKLHLSFHYFQYYCSFYELVPYATNFYS